MSEQDKPEQDLTLDQWLEYLEQCHPSSIELGLDRINRVAQKLPIGFPDTRIITVAGTNGKGSTVTMLSAILEQGGYSTCCYTSPHLLRYNERVKIGDRLATDEELCASFATVEAARGEIQLTYFEFGTLAAFQLFSTNSPDFIILEVGLGGRLDAVNILDADLAILTNVALDHTDWLGDTRDAIGIEKAGIFRKDKPALTGDKDMPSSVLEQVKNIGALHFGNGRDFMAEPHAEQTWHWRGADAGGKPLAIDGLPLNDFPLDNCATVVQAIALLAPAITPDEIAKGLGASSLTGRFQQVDRGYPLLMDVAHNPHAVRRLVEQVQARFPGSRVHLVIAMLADKDYRGVVDILGEIKPAWYVAGIQEERGLDGKILYNYLLEAGAGNAAIFPSIAEAFHAAEQVVKPGVRHDMLEAHQEAQLEGAFNDIPQGSAEKPGIILVAGSFFTVSAVLELI